MVWNQYVFEATTGNDAEYESDNDVFENDHEYTIEDWEIEYSEELHHMWNTVNTLFYDAHIEHTGRFCDFVEFCYIEHDYTGRVTWEWEEETMWYESRLIHVWKHIRRIVQENGLNTYMIRGASFDNFVHYAKNIMCIY